MMVWLKVVVLSARVTASKAICAEALNGFRQVYGEDHQYTLFAMAAMADILFHVDKTEEAEPLALQSYEKSRAKLGEDNWNTHEAVKVLVELYESRGNTERAAEWRSKLPADGM